MNEINQKSCSFPKEAASRREGVALNTDLLQVGRSCYKPGSFQK